jgi:hypothetical protein
MPIIQATRQAKMGRIALGDQPRQKVKETPSQPIKSGVWWHLPVILAMHKV